MRKPWTIGVILVLLHASGARSEAAFDLEAALYAGGGLSFPLGPSDFTDGWKRGSNWGGGIGYRLAPRSEIRVLLFANRFDLDTANLPGVSGGRYSILEGSVDYKLYLTGLRADDRLAAYLVAGIGIGGQTIASTTFPPPLGTSQEFTRTKHAYDLGGGVDFRVLARTAVFAEAKWILVRTEGDDTTFAPIRAGIRFLIAR